MKAYEREDLAELIIRAVNTAREYGRTSGNVKSDMPTIMQASERADVAVHAVWVALYDIRLDDGSRAAAAPRAGVSQPLANLPDETTAPPLADPE